MLQFYIHHKQKTMLVSFFPIALKVKHQLRNSHQSFWQFTDDSVNISAERRNMLACIYI